MATNTSPKGMALDVKRVKVFYKLDHRLTRKSRFNSKNNKSKANINIFGQTFVTNEKIVE